jgi:pimeloyl-ACP methyl ester carboxylesterase
MVVFTLLGMLVRAALPLQVAAPAPQPAAAYTDKFATVNGLRLHYLDWGNPRKPPLILIHGIARHAHTFDQIAPHFSRDYHVIAIDMRGHGDSDWDAAGRYLVEDHLKDLESLVKQLQLRQITLLGNSTGGRVVQVFAGAHPDLVSKLIVEDVGPQRPEDIAAGFARRVEQEANGWASEEELVQQTTRENPGVAAAWIRAYVHFGVKSRPDQRVVWKRDPKLVNGFVPTDLWRYVRRISSPTIYILGGRSRIVPAETQQQLKQVLPHIEIVIMPGLGHYPDVEAPEDFLTIVDRFLSIRPHARARVADIDPRALPASKMPALA